MPGYKPRWFTRPQTVTHPSKVTNQARRRVTSLIETNALPLSQAATKKYCIAVRIGPSNGHSLPTGNVQKISWSNWTYGFEIFDRADRQTSTGEAHGNTLQSAPRLGRSKNYRSHPLRVICGLRVVIWLVLDKFNLQTEN